MTNKWKNFRDDSAIFRGSVVPGYWLIIAYRPVSSEQLYFSYIQDNNKFNNI